MMNCRALTILLTTTRSSTFAFAPQSAAFSVASSTRHLGIATITQGGAKPLPIRNMSTETAPEPRKAGVSSPSELKEFVASAGSKLLVVDVRHPDATVEPGDAKSLTVAGFPDKESNYRPQAVNLPWSRETKGMELPSVDMDTPIITHCGGGGRGQK